MKNVFKRFLIVSIFLTWIINGYSVEVNARVSRTTIPIGDSATYFLQISGIPKKSRILGPWQVNWQSPLVLLQSKPLSQEEGKLTWVGVFTAIDTGLVVIPSFDIQVIKAPDTVFLKTNPITLSVIGTLQDKIVHSTAIPETLLEKNKPLKTIPPSIWEWLLWIGLPLSFIGLYFGFRKYRAYRKSLLPPPPPPPPPTPEEVVRRKLALIREEAKWQLGDVKGFVSDLVNALKEYIDVKFNLQTLESTTIELSDQKYANILGINEHQILIRMFGIADEVKFAKGNIANERCLEALKEAESIVETWYLRIEQEKQVQANQITPQTVESLEEKNLSNSDTTHQN